MADEVTPLSTPTSNYGWAKPTVGGDGDAWGGMINADLDGIDSTVKSVSTVANAAYPATNPTGYQTAAQVSASIAAAAYVLPTASTTVLGGVKVDGTSIRAAGDGTISTTVVPMGDNRIINGDMRIDQRNNGAGGTAVNAYTVDRWQYLASQAAKVTWGRVASSYPGFPNCLSSATTAAYTSVAADYFAFRQPIEADQISDFQFGTANAQPVTLSFWVSSSLAGTFSGALSNYAGTRSYPFTFTIPAANSNTRIVITIPGDTAGTWVMSGNGGGALVYFDLGCGSNNRGPAGAWASAAYMGATGSVSVVAVNAAAFWISGVKLEIGSVATPFNRQSLAKSLADCQRYFESGYDVGVSPGTASATPAFCQITTGSTSALLTAGNAVFYKATKRSTPTMTFYSPNTGASGRIRDGVNNTDVTPSLQTNSLTGFCWSATLSSASTSTSFFGQFTASAEL